MEDFDKIVSDIIEVRNRDKVGFKLVSLEVVKNPHLGNLKLTFCDDLRKMEDYPFSSILIGPNGTGKSNILRTIINLFREIHELVTSEDTKRGNYVQGGFSISYLFKGQLYSYGNLEYDEKGISLKDYHKKQKLWAKIDDYDYDYDNNNNFTEEINKFKLPKNIVASSIMVTDKYPYLNQEELPMYKYLGVRSSRRSSGTRAYVRKTVDLIQDSIDENQSEFTKKLTDILDYLELEKQLLVRYKPIYKSKFYRKDLTEVDFRSYFEHQKEYFPDRTSPIWGTSYYKKIADNDNLISRIVEFLKSMDVRFLGNDNLEDKTYMVYDIMSDKNLVEDFQMIKELKQLDLITYPSISLLKKGSEYDLEESSSGEYALLSSLIGLMASVSENSIVFIDEPEVSLHPNWQMKYMDFVRDIFKGYKSCHFIIATHSHFLVSDIERQNSQVIGLKKEEGIKPIHFSNLNTYGWSAEQVLLDVFDVPTTRNYYIAERLGELMDFVANPENDKKSIHDKFIDLKLDRIESLVANDPLKEVFERIKKKYVV